jgi:hypothetical protein
MKQASLLFYLAAVLLLVVGTVSPALSAGDTFASTGPRISVHQTDFEESNVDAGFYKKGKDLDAETWSPNFNKNITYLDQDPDTDFTGLQLTEVNPSQAGGVLHPHSIRTDGDTAFFRFKWNSGNGGSGSGDGLTLFFADPDKTWDLGNTGGSMGFAESSPTWQKFAIVLDSNGYYCGSSGSPDNQMCVDSDADNSSVDWESPAPPNGAATFDDGFPYTLRVEITADNILNLEFVDGGTNNAKFSVDLADSTNLTPPLGDLAFGFSAGTGADDNDHQIIDLYEASTTRYKYQADNDTVQPMVPGPNEVLSDTFTAHGGAGSPWTWSVASGPTHGTINTSPSGDQFPFDYTAPGYFAGVIQDTFTVQLEDSNNDIRQTQVVIQSPDNTAPVLDDTSKRKRSNVWDVGQSSFSYDTFTINELVTSDSVTNSPGTDTSVGVAITSQDTANKGTWQYTLDGSTWDTMPDLSGNNAAVFHERSNSEVTFRFKQEKRVSDSATLEFRAWDQTDGSSPSGTQVNVSSTGGTTAFSSQAGTVELTISKPDGPVTFYVNDDSTNNDQFVNATGKDTGTLGSKNDPFRTINYAINADKGMGDFPHEAASPGDTIIIDAGTYFPDAQSISGQQVVIFDTNALHISGADSSATILKAGQGDTESGGFKFDSQSNITMEDMKLEFGRMVIDASAGTPDIPSDSNTIQRIHFASSVHNVYILQQSSNNIIKDNLFTGSVTPIRINKSDSNLIENNTLRNNVNEFDNGNLYIDGNADSNTVKGNLFTSNEGTDIELNGEGISGGDPDHTLIKSNTIKDGALQSGDGEGIYLNQSGIDHRIFGNTIKNNSVNNAGIRVGSGSDTQNAFSTIRDNTIKDNDGNGMDLGNIDTSVITHNVIIGNTSKGLKDYGDNNRIQLNTLKNNEGYQLKRIMGEDNTVTKNNIIPSSTNPDSAIQGSGGENKNTLIRNWFGVTDKAEINSRIKSLFGADISSFQFEAGYVPYRLGPVDTGVGADTFAPYEVTVDTVVSGGGQAEIRWEEVTRNENNSGSSPIASDFMEYRVYRDTDPGQTDWKQNATLVGTVGTKSDTNFIDTSVEAGVTYYYRVTAVDNPGVDGGDGTSDLENESYIPVDTDDPQAGGAAPVRTVQIDTSGNGSATLSDGGDFVEGETVTVIADPDTGTRFIAWVEGSDTRSTSPDYTFTVSGDSNLTAKIDTFATMVTAPASTTKTVNEDGSVTWTYENADGDSIQVTQYSDDASANSITTDGSNGQSSVVKFENGTTETTIDTDGTITSTNTTNGVTTTTIVNPDGTITYSQNGGGTTTVPAGSEIYVDADGNITVTQPDDMSPKNEPSETISKESACFVNDFEGGKLNGWSTLNSKNYEPRVVAIGTGKLKNRMRLTQNRKNQAGGVTKDIPIPSDKRVEVSFYAHTHGGSGGDGLAMVLSAWGNGDTPSVGALGGALGYAQSKTSDGFDSGWLAIGLDEGGNFANSNDGKEGGPGYRRNAISIRGSGSGQNGYRYIAGTRANLAPKFDHNMPGQRFRVIIDSESTSDVLVSVLRSTGREETKFDTLLSKVNITDALAQDTVPERFRLSFTGSTSKSTNYHEVGFVKVSGRNCGGGSGPQVQSDTFSAIEGDTKIDTVKVNTNDTVSFFLSGGADSDVFNIDPTTGDLSFDSPLEVTGEDSFIAKVNAEDSAGLKGDTPATIRVNGFPKMDVNINTPAGGEFFAPDDGETITWSSTESINPVDTHVVKLRAFDTATFDTIAVLDGTALDSAWTVPDTTTDQARLKVEAIDTGGQTVSDSTPAFYINKSVISLAKSGAGSGTVAGNGMYNVGDSVTIDASPDSQSVFARWESDGSTVSTSPGYTFAASADSTLYTAVFDTFTSNVIAPDSATTTTQEDGSKVTTYETADGDSVQVTQYSDGSSGNSFTADGTNGQSSIINFEGGTTETVIDTDGTINIDNSTNGNDFDAVIEPDGTIKFNDGGGTTTHPPGTEINVDDEGNVTVTEPEDTLGGDVSTVQQCYVNDFSNGTLKGWSTLEGKNFTPEVVTVGDGKLKDRMRLTENQGNQASGITKNIPVPTDQKVEIEFYSHAHGGNGADGIAMILSEWGTGDTPSVGGFGGSLGYAQINSQNGFDSGWLAVGLDEWGNFSNPTENREEGPGFRKNAVVIRGSGEGQNGYKYIDGTKANLDPKLDNNFKGQRFQITIDSTGPDVLVTVERSSGRDANSFDTLLKKVNVTEDASQDTIPDQFRLSFTASTGGYYNYHEVSFVEVSASNCSKGSGPEVESDTFSALEGDTQTGQVTDKNNEDDISFFLSGGPDSDVFNIDPATGELSFKDPLDVVGEDSFIVEVNAEDSAGIEGDTPATIRVNGFERLGVNLKKPSGGELFTGGETTAINWSGTDSVEPIDTYVLRYRGFDTGGFDTLAVKGPSVGDSTWTIPDTHTQEARIQIEAIDKSGTSVFDTSPRLTIDNRVPSVSLDQAPSDTALAGGDTYGLRWTATDSFGLDTTPITLEYSPDSGANWETIGTELTNSGQFDWTIPSGNTDSGLVRITAVDTVGITGYDTSGLFTVDSIDPDTVSLITPVDKLDTDLTSQEFTWKRSTDTGSGIKGYSVRLAEDAGFTSVVFDSFVDGPDTSLNHAFTRDGVYHWKVNVVDTAGNRSAFTSADTFQIDTTAPDTFGLLSPEDGSATNVTDVVLDWESTVDSGVGFKNFQVQLDTGAGFSTIRRDSFTNSSDTVFTLNREDTFYWRIRAYDTLDNVTSWVGPDSFTRDITNPDTATQIRPLGETIDESPALFDWNVFPDTGAGIDEYFIHVASDTMFSDTVYASRTGRSQSDTSIYLEPGNYAWRVYGIDRAGNRSPWVGADTVSVVDSTAPADTFSLLTPIDGAETSVQPVSFDWQDAHDTFTGVKDYRIAVANDTNFTDTVIVDRTAIPRSDTTFELPGDTIYYWKVLARDTAGNESRYVGPDTFIVDRTAPADTFELVSPVTGHETNAKPVVFEWGVASDTLTGISGYRIQVSDSTTFNTIVEDQVVNGTSTSLPVNPDGTLYWRVSAIDEAGNTSAWVNGTPNTFVVDRTAPKPGFGLIAPPDGHDTRSRTITLDWENTSDTGVGLDNYRVQLDTEPTMGSSFVDQARVTSDSTVTLSTGKTYYWRVRAKDTLGNTTAFSDTVQFTIDVTAPDTVSLQDPVDGADTNGSPVNFDWDSSGDTGSGVADYRIQVDTNTVYNRPLVDTVVDHPTTKMKDFLATQDVYQWRVYARDNAANTSGWTESDSFVVDNVSPDSVSLLEPADGTDTKSNQLTFEWTGANDAGSGLDGYNLIIDTSPTFGSPSIDTFVESPDTSLTTTIDTDARYFWRVTARDNAGNVSAASDSRTFTIKTKGPAIDTSSLRVNDNLSPILNQHDLDGDSALVSSSDHKYAVRITNEPDTVEVFYTRDGSVATTGDSSFELSGDTGDEWSGDLSRSLFSDGDTINFIVRGRDRLGNTTIADSAGSGFEYRVKQVDILARDGRFETVSDSPIAVTLDAEGIDSDSITYSLVDPGSLNGTVSDTERFPIESNTNPVLNYNPDGFSGSESLEFTASNRKGTDTGTLTFDVTEPTDITITNVSSVPNDTPLIAEEGGTITVNVTVSNSGGTGAVIRDTNSIRAVNGDDADVTDQFSRQLIGPKRVTIPANSDTTIQWKMTFSDTINTDAIGGLSINVNGDSVDVYDRTKGETTTGVDKSEDFSSGGSNFLVILTSPGTVDTAKADGGIDTATRTIQSVSIGVGYAGDDSNLSGNDEAWLDTGGLNASRILFLVERFDASNDTPSFGRSVTRASNPGYSFYKDPAGTFVQAVQEANQTMQKGTVKGESEPIDNSVIQVSIWKNRTGNIPNYLGDSLTENTRLTIRNVVTDRPETLKVVKMDTATEEWFVIDQDPAVNNVTGDTYNVIFDVPASTGFSVFQVISGPGVVNTGRAGEAIAYPNPFIPFDGREATGEYGPDRNDGLHFGAGTTGGQIEGFPSGTNVKVYNVVGELIDEFQTMSGGVIQWDARTRGGEPVASGTYFFVLDVPNGGQKVGKFSIVR